MKGITRCLPSSYTSSRAQSGLKMGLSREAITGSLAYFKQHGRHCDCEVLLNVDFDRDDGKAA